MKELEKEVNEAIEKHLPSALSGVLKKRIEELEKNRKRSS